MRKNILDKFKDRFDNFNDWIKYNNVFFNIYEPEFRIKIELDNSHKQLESYARNIAPIGCYQYYSYIFNYNGLDICDIPVVALDYELFIPLPKYNYIKIDERTIPIWFYCKDDIRYKLFLLLNKKVYKKHYMNKLPIIIFEDKDEMFDFVKHLEGNKKGEFVETIKAIDKSTNVKELKEERIDKQINLEYIKYLNNKGEK